MLLIQLQVFKSSNGSMVMCNVNTLYFTIRYMHTFQHPTLNERCVQPFNIITLGIQMQDFIADN